MGNAVSPEQQHAATVLVSDNFNGGYPVTGLTPAPANPQPLDFSGTSVQPLLDVVEFLPAGIPQDRLRQLRQRANDKHAIIPEFETVRQAAMERVEAERALARLVNHPQDHGFNLPLTNARVIEATKLLEKLTADLKRLQELQQVRTAQWQAASGAKAASEAWLRDGRPHGATLEVFDAEPPRLAKGETVLNAVERVRRRGRELRADLHRIRSAPFPSNYAKSQMRAQIDALTQRGAPDVTNLIEHDRDIIWPTLRVQSEVHAEKRGLAFAEVPDALALVAWLHKDELIAALDREIVTEADDKAALSHEARGKAEVEVLADLLDMERQEAELVWQAQSQGLPVEHRADCDPCAILQIKLVTAPRATAAETSPGMSWLRI